jgi:protein-S-isoprenylcysteine O-methyltransferase Ste14
MDFYSKPKKLYFLHIVLLVVFLILFFINVFNILTNRSASYWGILSNGLLAIAMVFQIRAYKKQNK